MPQNHRKINGNSLSEYLIQWLKDWFAKNGRDTAVIGISGGKDSAIVAALCAKAIGAGNVLGVMMPNGIQDDIEDSYKVCEELGIKGIEIPIGNPLFKANNAPYHIVSDEYPYGSLIECIDESFSSLGDNDPLKVLRVSAAAKINIAPRLRMTVLYAIAQSLSRVGRHACVVGTGNLGEASVGYTTKWGDSACDVNPIRNLWVDEVLAVGDALGYFPEIIHKVPRDGLCGESDETRLGFSYADVKQVLDANIRGSESVSDTTREKIISAYRRSSHKRDAIPAPERKAVVSAIKK